MGLRDELQNFYIVFLKKNKIVFCFLIFIFLIEKIFLAKIGMSVHCEPSGSSTEKEKQIIRL